MSVDNFHTVTFVSTGAIYPCHCDRNYDHIASIMTPEDVLKELLHDKKQVGK